jgi:hypothetical protein
MARARPALPRGWVIDSPERRFEVLVGVDVEGIKEPTPVTVYTSG